MFIAPARREVFTFTFWVSRTSVSRQFRFSIRPFKLILVVIFVFSFVLRDTHLKANVMPKCKIARSFGKCLCFKAKPCCRGLNEGKRAAAVLSDRITFLTNRIVEACGIIDYLIPHASSQRNSHRSL